MTPQGLRRAALVIMGGSLLVAGRVMAESSEVVEWHRTVIYPWFASFVQPIFGSAGGSAGEVLAVSAMGLVVVALIRRRWLALLLTAAAVIFGFYMSWGLAYGYPPLGARLAPLPVASGGPAARARLVDLTERSAQLLVRASRGSPITGTDLFLLTRINAGLRLGAMRLPLSVDATPVRRVAFGPVKLSRFSFALSHLQLSGYYFPWTGEAQINAEMPRTLWPRVAAHEQAHQFGFARENEATVIGLLACLESPEPTVFYSGALGLFASFDRELMRADPGVRRRLWAGLPRRVTEDFAKESEFWNSHAGVAGAISEGVNDSYLKAQGVRSGVGSYTETTRLLLQAIETPGLRLDSLLAGDGPPWAAGPPRPNGGKR